METDNTLVTIFTLSYNSPNIYEAIDSVLKQDYPSIQYILVDDCSSKFDANEINYYVNSNKKNNIIDFELIVHNQNKGIVYSANEAIKKAKGKYVFNVAGDDAFYDDRVVSDWVDFFNKTNAIVATGYRAIYDEDLSIKLDKLPKEKQVNIIKTSSPTQLFRSMEGYNLIFGCCTAYSKECFDKYGLFDDKYRLLDDYPKYLQLCREGVKIEFFDRIVVKYRLGGISYAQNIDDKYFEENDAVFENEVLPYSDNADRAKKAYLQWKKDVKKAQENKQFIKDKLKALALIDKYNNNIFVYMLAYTCLALKHPIKAISKIKRLILKEDK